MAALLSRFSLTLPSPTPHLLSSNDVPNPEEEEEIRAHIERLDGMVNDPSRKDSVLSRYPTQQLINALHAHRQLLRTTARKLPPEIIQHISLYTPLPWTLSWVCSTWRSATKDYKKLWSILPMLELTQKKNKKPQGVMRCSQELLRRSGDHPSSVDLRAFELSDTRPLFHFFLRHANNWVEAHLELHPSLVVEFQKATGDMEKLRHLTIAVAKPQPFQDTSHRLDLKGLVSLRSLKKCTPWPIPPLSLPKDTITSYIGKIWDADLIDHLELLSPTLETLILTCNRFGLHPNARRSEVGPFLFPKLTEIALYEGPFNSRCRSSPFLYMTTPTLRTAKISQCAPDTFTSFSEMVQRSDAGLMLTTLHIWSVNGIPYDSLFSLFTETTNLTDLKVADRLYTAPDIFSLLSTTNGPGPSFLLPKLERLAVFLQWNTHPDHVLFQALHTIGLLRTKESITARRLKSFEVGLLSADVIPDPPHPHQKQNTVRVYLDPRWKRKPNGSMLKALEEIALTVSSTTERLLSDIEQGRAEAKRFDNLEAPLRRLLDLSIPSIQEVHVGFFCLPGISS